MEAEVEIHEEAEIEIDEEAEGEIHEEAKEMGLRKPKQTVEARVTRPPHNYAAIVKDSDVRIQTFPLHNLCDQLYHGVVLQQGKRKYWVDRHLNKNCFMVFARELAITWGDTDQYWGWKTIKESGGKFRTIMLSPKTLYEVVLVALMTESSWRWDVPVKIHITLPDASKLERMENLQDKPRGEWMDIFMGEFVTSSQNIGEIKFYISETSSMWKQGLIVKGVAFRPKS